MNKRKCGWHAMYYPGEEPPEFGEAATDFDTHGMCERCQERFLAGEGARWQVWETRPGLGLPPIVALPAHFDLGRVTTYRVRELANGGSDKLLSSRVLDAHWQFTGRVLEEVEA